MRKNGLFLVFLLFLMSPILALSESIINNPPAIEKLANSVVMLNVYDENSDLIATGSGFILFDNRTLITNYHVIKNAEMIIAESDDGDQYFVNKVLVISEKWDIAILQFMAPTIIEPLDYSFDDLLRGAPVVVVGSPKGFRNTVSTGIVSAIYLDEDIHWIQFTAPASPGSSGGPIFNEHGKVIGMTTWNRSDAQNINFAIGVQNIIELYEKWDRISSWNLHELEKAILEEHSIGEEKVISVTQMAYTIHFESSDQKGLYTGDTINGLPNGYGLFTAQNEYGREWHYIGEWIEGKMNGNGSLYIDGTDGVKIQKGKYENNALVVGEKAYLSNALVFKIFDKEGNSNDQFFEVFLYSYSKDSRHLTDPKSELVFDGYLNFQSHKVICAYRYVDGKRSKFTHSASDQEMIDTFESALFE